MADKKKLDQDDRKNLLGELESVKDLLVDEEQIPLLVEEQPKTESQETPKTAPAVAEGDQSAQESLFPAETATADTSKNPFLSADIKEKLAKSRNQAHKELNQLISTSGASTDRRKPENWQKAQQRLRAKSASILQEIIEEAIPGLETELRNRLRLEMDLILEEMERPKD